MFQNNHHQKIYLILNSLNADIFTKAGAYFGGGTLITLQNNEYRWSKDVDFICPVGDGYRYLRKLVADSNLNPKVFFTKTKNLEFPRDLKADQYGIRFLVVAEEVPIKFEIIAEARVKLNPPQSLGWTQVPALNFEDQCTEKLLANADRWTDSSTESRDLIDLSVLRKKGPLPESAISKAENAYPVIPELKKALTKFLNDERYQNKCFTTLEIENRKFILEGTNLLHKDFS